MKLTLCLLLIITNAAFCQELVKNEIDEFTKRKVKETSFEPIVQSFSMGCFFSVKAVDSTKYLYATITIGTGTGSFHTIDRDASLYLKLANDSIVELKNMEYTMSCKGCAYNGRFVGSQAEGSKTAYLLSDRQIKILQASPLKKIRIYTSKGYIESEVKEPRSNILKAELALIR